MDLELNITEMKDTLKKDEARSVTMGAIVGTTKLNNTSSNTKATTPTLDCTSVASTTTLRNTTLSDMSWQKHCLPEC